VSKIFNALAVTASAAAVAVCVPGGAAHAETTGGDFTLLAPTGALTCTLTYESKVAGNPNKPKPTYVYTAPAALTVNANGAYNYTFYDATATVNYAVCVAI
jgi:hypothetical protein